MAGLTLTEKACGLRARILACSALCSSDWSGVLRQSLQAQLLHREPGGGGEGEGKERGEGRRLSNGGGPAMR